jgi:gluconokinase
MATVSRKQAQAPTVLAIDVGSSASRGRLFDATGSSVDKLEVRIRHQLTEKSDGTVTIDAEAVCDEVVEIIDRLVAKAGKRIGAIAGVAMDTFALSLVGVNKAGRPVTPAYTYADSRPAPQVRQLQQSLDEQAVQQRTGCRFHASYLPARLLWLSAAEPQTAARVDAWLSLGEYVYLKLLGEKAASFSTAAWTGMLDRRTLRWDEQLIAALPLAAAQLSPLRDTSEPLQGLRRPYARRWPALAQARWFPAIADGYANNVGVGAVDASQLAVSLGTSGAVRALLGEQPETIPEGLWCYAVDRRRALLGGALNDAGRAVAWLRGLLKLADAGDFRPLLLEPPSPATPTVLPFVTGERSPGWASSATASFSRMDVHTTPAALFRGLLEGIGLRLGLITAQVRSVATGARRLLASGGAIEDLPEWNQILADITGLPAALSLEGQTTLRGTALIALEVLAADVVRPAAEVGNEYAPRLECSDAYREAARRQQEAYGCLVTRA